RINAGIVLHEYAHAVFQRLVYADARGAPYNSSRRAWSDAAINALDATNEGLADTFAAVALGQPDAFAASIPAADRDVSKTRLLGLEMFAALAATPPEAYNAYAVGSVVASTLWALRSLTDDATLGRAILAAMRGSGEYVRARKSYHLAVFFNHLHAALPAAVRPQACAIFEARLVALQGALSCPR
ncbi:MAG TPA: hypothetical protein VFH51_07260, partial [Myxococcota bacterium]|nr:hypothetical protein [Myxococcota bacterium]